MSEYSMEHETQILPGDSTPLTAADLTFVFSQGHLRTKQTTLGSVGAMTYVTSATSATTATNIESYGYTSLGSSSGPITGWLLDSPLTAGLKKVIQSLGTSTAHTVTVSTTAVTIISTASNVGTVITFSNSGGAVELTSVSTSQWAVTAHTVTGTIVA